MCFLIGDNFGRPKKIEERSSNRSGKDKSSKHRACAAITAFPTSIKGEKQDSTMALYMRQRIAGRFIGGGEFHS